MRLESHVGVRRERLFETIRELRESAYELACQADSR